MQLEDSIYIDAPPEVVWRVTVDIERWPEWTPNFRSVKRLEAGAFGIGCRARIKQPGLPEAEWVVAAFVPGERFTWETRVRGTRMIATHELSPEGAGTRSVLRIEILGLIAKLLWPLIRGSVRRSIARENQGLKRRSESSEA